MSSRDELEIRNLVARLALVADSGDGDEYASLFADNAVWEMRLPGRQAKAQGIAEIKKGFEVRVATGVQGPLAKRRHALSTHAISVQGDRATGNCYMLVFKTDGGSPAPATLAVYSDHYVKTEKGWLLSNRIISEG